MNPLPLQMVEANSRREEVVLPRAFPLSLPRNPAARALKLAVGQLLLHAMPRRAEALVKARRYQRYTQVDRWMLATLGQSALREGRIRDLHDIHRKFWMTDVGTQTMSVQSWRFESLFLAHHQAFVAPFLQAVEAAGCRQLLEMGCGTGEIVTHFASRLPKLERAIGIDLNEGLIEECRERWSGTGVHFLSGDGASTVRAIAQGPMAFLSYGGVLEYFLEEDLVSLLRWLSQNIRPCVFGCVEPIDDALLLDHPTHSIPYGSELSFSHHYPDLLQRAGFELCFVQDCRAGDQRFLMVVARTPEA